MLLFLFFTWVVNSSLDDTVDGEAAWGDLIAELGVDLRGQFLGHPVVVFGEVGEVLRRGVVLLVKVRHLEVVYALKPKWSKLRSKFKNSFIFDEITVNKNILQVFIVAAKEAGSQNKRLKKSNCRTKH